VLAGKCGGYFKTGQCVPAGKTVNAVLAELCEAMGVHVDYIGDPKFAQRMPEIAA
jgi:hypothetical protein